VLLNLYSNALKFTEKKGKITIMVEKFDNPMFPPNLRLTVVDSGLGIKDEN